MPKENCEIRPQARSNALLRTSQSLYICLYICVLSDEQQDFLGEFDRYQIEGRYPEFLEESPGQDEADAALLSAGKMMEWLKSQL